MPDDRPLTATDIAIAVLVLAVYLGGLFWPVWRRWLGW
jgi:hypothetical protein